MIAMLLSKQLEPSIKDILKARDLALKIQELNRNPPPAPSPLKSEFMKSSLGSLTLSLHSKLVTTIQEHKDLGHGISMKQLWSICFSFTDRTLPIPNDKTEGALFKRLMEFIGGSPDVKETIMKAITIRLEAPHGFINKSEESGLVQARDCLRSGSEKWPEKSKRVLLNFRISDKVIVAMLDQLMDYLSCPKVRWKIKTGFRGGDGGRPTEDSGLINVKKDGAKFSKAADRLKKKSAKIN